MAEGLKSFADKHGVAIALGVGGLGVAWLVASQAGGSGKTLWPRTFGGQRGQASRSSSSSNDSGSLATQVIGDIIGQRTALVEAHDQLLATEASLTEQQNVAYRNSNVAVQENLNDNGLIQAISPPWYASILGSAFNDLPMAFGMPPMYGGGSSGFPGGFSGNGYGGGYGGFYPQQYFPSPYGAPGGYGSAGSGGMFGGFIQWLYGLFTMSGGGSPAPSGSGGGVGFLE